MKKMTWIQHRRPRYRRRITPPPPPAGHLPGDRFADSLRLNFSIVWCGLGGAGVLVAFQSALDTTNWAWVKEAEDYSTKGYLHLFGNVRGVRFLCRHRRRRRCCGCGTESGNLELFLLLDAECGHLPAIESDLVLRSNLE